MIDENMPTTGQNSNQPVVFERDGRVFASSRDVAECFEKRHDNVMRDIDNLLKDINSSKLRSGLFQQIMIPDGQGIDRRAFDMTRDGFMLLAMGFTGSRAMAFKLRYIEQFNAMEAALKAQTALPDAAANGALIQRIDGISRMVAHKITGTEKMVKMIAESVGRSDARIETVETAVIDLAGRVRDLMLIADDRGRATREHISVRQLLDDAGAAQKGRNGLNRRVGNALRAMALTGNPPIPVRRCMHSGVWLFPVDLATGFMRSAGNRWVRDHNAKDSGQGLNLFSDQTMRRSRRKPAVQH